MDIGSSTPKKRKSRTPLKSVLKVKTTTSDEETPVVNAHLNVGTVMFSTPVSSQKVPRGGLLKLKTTRFDLPQSGQSLEKNRDILPMYLKMVIKRE